MILKSAFSPGNGTPLMRAWERPAPRCCRGVMLVPWRPDLGEEDAQGQRVSAVACSNSAKIRRESVGAGALMAPQPRTWPKPARRLGG